MEWIVNNKKEFEARQEAFKKTIEEKRQQVIKLNFEIASLNYLYDYFKNECNW